MIVFADADAIRTAHIMEFFGLLAGGQKDAGVDGSGRPAAQLAILPGLTHYNISSSPPLATVVALFLNAPKPGLQKRIITRGEAGACAITRSAARPPPGDRMSAPRFAPLALGGSTLRLSPRKSPVERCPKHAL
jgi:hypothetical protein